MTIDPVSSALQGIQTNVAGLDRAAQQISTSGAGGDVVDIAAALVAMTTAEIGTEASIAAIKSANEMQASLIDILV
jgi:hypothetical protein